MELLVGHFQVINQVTGCTGINSTMKDISDAKVFLYSLHFLQNLLKISQEVPGQKDQKHR